MTNSNPNIRLIEPAHPPDQLSEAVLGALARRMGPRTFWGPIKTLALGLLTGGLLPLILLPAAFRDFIRAEKNHLMHFAEWLRLQFPGKESEGFHHAIGKLRFRASFWVGSLALAALAIFWAWSDLSRMAEQPITPAFLFNFTTRLPKLPEVVRLSTAVPRVMAAAEGFSLLLIAAHLLMLWQVIAHMADMQRAAVLFNAVATKHQLPQLAKLRLRWGWSPIWIVSAVACALLGALWGVPMMLAAAAQARYINGTGRMLRLTLSACVFNVLAARRPILDVPLPTPLRGACGRGNCTRILPAGASFCPRCGLRVEARPDLTFM